MKIFKILYLYCNERVDRWFHVTRSIKFSLLKINEDSHQTEFRSKADGNELGANICKLPILLVSKNFVQSKQRKYMKKKKKKPLSQIPLIEESEYFDSLRERGGGGEKEE